MQATHTPVPLDYASLQRRPSRHLFGIGMVVLLHVLLVWAISSGLARKFVKAVKPPVETKLIEDVKIPLPPPPPPKVDKAPPPPPPAYVPP
ncbi:MAG: hypothetical protein RLZZ401_197, partial [Pseudomonadota bacterium]